MELWWNLDILWWNLDILWWNLDRFEHKFDGNITNWPCWSEGKLGTGPFTWLGQGFHTNFLEIPFQKGEKRHFDGLSIARKIGFMLTPVFCNASRNTDLLWCKKRHWQGAPTDLLWCKKRHWQGAPTDLLWCKKRHWQGALTDLLWCKKRHWHGAPTDLLDV